jgi:hypothetical protein
MTLEEISPCRAARLSGVFALLTCRYWAIAFSFLLGLLAVASARGACSPVVNGIVGWWAGDGNGNDLAGTNAGVLQGGATATAAGLVGSAFGFDGTNSYVQIPDGPMLRPANLTIEAWVRFSSLESAGTASAGQQYIVFKQNSRSSFFEGYSLAKMRTAGGDVLAFVVSSALGQLAQLQSTTPVTTGLWYHVAGVRGSDFTQLYVNGQLERQTNVTFPQDYGNYPLFLGSSGQAYWDGKLKGSLDEVSLYNRTLSSNEIAAIYMAGSAGKCKTGTDPRITSQPQGQSVAVGNSAIFQVTAAGTSPFGYQWRKNGANLFDGGNVSGATSAALTLAKVQTNDAGNFQVVVTDSVGSVTSAIASLTVTPPLQPISQSAGAVVLVNSQSARFLDFKHYIQPYLDNFGFPYSVQDIATDMPGQSISNCAVIIIGHSQLDTNRSYLSPAVQSNLSMAVSNGTGLVNFDNDLYSGSAPRYQFVQDLFGFSYGPGGTATNVSLPPTEPSSQMHFITARHPTNDLVLLRSSMPLPGIGVPSTVTTLALGGGQPLVAVAKYGQGRAVQWGSYDWMVSTVLGPIGGLDDLVWRGIVWAGRKPLVMRGVPSFVTLRVDDTYGPFDWLHTANAVGFKPFLALFYGLVSEASAADLRNLITNGNATASIHSIDNSDAFFYFNHATRQPWPDNVQSNNFYWGTQWHLNHSIPISKVVVSHWNEIGVNCFGGLKAWGVEFFASLNIPGQVQFITPGGAPWLVAGPYRLYETPQQAQVSWPSYYADWLSIPDHPEFDGQFFNYCCEMRDAGSCGEWCPDNDVAGTVARGTRTLKVGLDSMVMASIYTHEWRISPIYPVNWQAILQGITNNLASYNPIFVTLDYAAQYVRATRTSRLENGIFDPGSGQVSASFSGYADLDTQAYVFVGADNAITYSMGPVPAFLGPVTNVLATLGAQPAPPMVVNPPAALTTNTGATAVFTVGAAGTAPLSYRWYQNLTPLSNGGNIFGASSPRLTLTGVAATNSGTYSVVVTNQAGSVTSLVATLTVIPALRFTSASLLPGKIPSFTVNGASNSSYRIDTSTNLATWTTLTNVSAPNGTAQFVDTAATAFSRRFYRAVWVP